MLIYEDIIDCSTRTFAYFKGIDEGIDELRNMAKRFEDISCYIHTALQEQKTLDIETANEFIEKASYLNEDVHKLAHQILFKKRV